MRRTILLLVCGEMLDRAPHTIVMAIASHRVNLVVVSRPRLKTIDTNSENRI